ncbi:MAG: Vitamin B12 dependent methionine synthase activation subunit [Oscillospiraceae bacterium]|nr:Vitamin B12 dependent methionine synthase activation subunit [Oscillospiraceae bacterium]
MMTPVQRWSAPLPEVDLREMLRYAACRAPDEQVTALAASAAEEGCRVLRPALCWREVPLTVTAHRVDLGFTAFDSQKLAAVLTGCDRAVIFAATMGLELDRLIARHGRLSPARGLMLQALGAERIEALCDSFCDFLAAEYAPLTVRRRFSPGYGDLPLENQRAFFDVLQCHKEIGLYLNESLLMSPTKSVTAIVGLGRSADCSPAGCSACEKKDCVMRKA